MFIQDFLDEFARYRKTAEKAMQQVSDDALNTPISREGNSIGTVICHVSGNFKSRFSGFLTSDGEKPMRDRDSEFEERQHSRAEIEAMWLEGWAIVEREVGSLRDADLNAIVTVRGNPLTVHEALCRSVSHAAYHTGQIVLLARVLATSEWRWISIPKGKSREYNRNPNMEKGPI